MVVAISPLGVRFFKESAALVESEGIESRKAIRESGRFFAMIESAENTGKSPN